MDRETSMLLALTALALFLRDRPSGPANTRAR
jgi:hypothetical protein